MCILTSLVYCRTDYAVKVPVKVPVLVDFIGAYDNHIIATITYYNLLKKVGAVKSVGTLSFSPAATCLSMLTDACECYRNILPGHAELSWLYFTVSDARSCSRGYGRSPLP